MTQRVNLVLEYSGQVPWYTDMAATLLAMGTDPAAYDWYVSDVETNVPVPSLHGGDAWMTGRQLSALLGFLGTQHEQAAHGLRPVPGRFDLRRQQPVP